MSKDLILTIKTFKLGYIQHKIEYWVKFDTFFRQLTVIKKINS